MRPPITHRTAEISGGGAKYPLFGAFRRIDLVSGFLGLCHHGRYGRSVSAPHGKTWRPPHLLFMETAEIFLPIFWVAFAPIVVLVLAIGAEWIGD